MNADKTTDGLVEGHLRKNLESRRKDGEAAVHPLLIEIDDAHARAAVSTIIQAYDMDDSLPDFEDTNLARAIANSAGADSLHKAIDDGNISKSGFVKGVEGGRDAYYNVTHYVESEWEKAIDGQGVMKSLINGDEGSGKSNWAVHEAFIIAARVIKRETNKKVLGISNVDINVDTTNLDKYIQVESTSKLDEIIEEYGDKEDWEVIVMLDEGDQLFGGSSNTHKANELGDRIKLMRHNHFHILMTSQRQVAPEIRNRFKIRHKPDYTKPWIMYFAKSTDKEGNPEDIIFKSKNIPETTVEYGGAGTWVHDVGSDGDVDKGEIKKLEEKIEEEKRELNIKLKNLYENTDMSYREIGDAVGLGKSAVGDRINKAKEY